MKQSNSEDIYKRIANSYNEQLGEILRQENASVPQLPNDIHSRLDHHLQKKLRARKIIRFTKIAGAVAACFLLVLFLPLLFRIQDSSKSPADTAQEHASSEMPEASLIPLSFSLPSNLSVSNTKVDRGISVYYLTDTMDDNVVMQLEPIDTANTDFSALKTLDIEGKEVYAASTRNFKLLTFIHKDIVYTLTCRYEIDTLLELSKNIF